MSILMISSRSAMRSTLGLLMVGAAILLIKPEASAQKPVLVCPAPKGERQIREFSGYGVRLVWFPRASEPMLRDCDPSRKQDCR